MRSEIAERTRPGRVRVEAPGVVGRRPPLLQVAPAKVMNLAQLARLDHLACQSNGGDEAVVERGHVLDAGCLHALPDLIALVGSPAQRFLAEDVLAQLGCGNRRVGVQVVRAAVVEELDVRIGDQFMPVAHMPLEAVALRRRGDGLLVSPGE